MPKKYKHGFVVISAQPYHIGHDRLIKYMLEQCEFATIAVSPAQEVGTKDNPYPYHIRKKMLQNVFKTSPDYQKLWIVGVDDVPNVLQWPKAVLQAIADSRPDIEAPEVFFGGLESDFEWFSNYINNFEICDRKSQDFPFLSGSMVRDMIRMGDERWKDFVPSVNHEIIEKNLIK